MTSLADAYDRQASEVSRRRLYAGLGLFAVGALLVLGAVLAGATSLLTDAGLAWWESREVAGVLAGLGVPATFVGIFAVFPATRGQRVGAAIGAAVAVLGVVLFQHAYPFEWGVREPTALALFTVAVYFVGALTTFWYMFVAAATFKRRNDPGGTVTLEFTEGGETKTVEVAAGDAAAAKSALGSVGVFGGVDDPGDATRPERSGTAGGAGGRATGSVSDGGATESDISSPMDDGTILEDEPATPASAADTYCGNCAHFEHVRTEEGIQPYCGHHDELMDDMDACEQWAPNRRV